MRSKLLSSVLAAFGIASLATVLCHSPAQKASSARPAAISPQPLSQPIIASQKTETPPTPIVATVKETAPSRAFPTTPRAADPTLAGQQALAEAYGLDIRVPVHSAGRRAAITRKITLLDPAAPGYRVQIQGQQVQIEGRVAAALAGGAETLLVAVADAPQPAAREAAGAQTPVNTPQPGTFQVAETPFSVNEPDRSSRRSPYQVKIDLEYELFMTKWGSDAYDQALRAALPR